MLDFCNKGIVLFSNRQHSILNIDDNVICLQQIYFFISWNVFVFFSFMTLLHRIVSPVPCREKVRTYTLVMLIFF